MRIGVQVASLRLPLKKALPLVAEMGATAVELDARGEFKPNQMTDTGLRQIRKWLDDYNLKVSAVRFQTRRGYDVADDLQRRIDATKSALRFAFAMKCNVVTNQVGRISADEKGSPAWQTLVESLHDLGNFSQHVGAWVAMDTGTEDGSDMAALIGALPVGSVMVSLNPGNLIVNGFSPSEMVASVGEHIAHVQATDGVRDLARGRGLEVPLGQGSADFPNLVGRLEEHGYRGYYTVANESTDAPIQHLSLAVQYLQNL